MKRLFIFISILLMLDIQLTYPQVVIKRIQKYVLLDIDESSGVQIYDCFDLYRKDNHWGETNVGRIRIIRFQSGKCAAQIIEEDIESPIIEGDFIKLQSAEAESDNSKTETFILDEPSYKIMRRNGDYVLIDADKSAGFKVDKMYPIRSLLHEKDEHEVGVIKITQFFNNRFIGRVLNERSNHFVAKGDRVIPVPIENQKSSASGKPLVVMNQNKNHLLTYSALTGGLVAAGLSFFFYEQMNKKHDEYELATTSEDASRLYDETLKLYDNSQIALKVGGGLVVFGLVYALINKGKPAPSIRSDLSIQTVTKKDYVGLGVSFDIGQ